MWARMWPTSSPWCSVRNRPSSASWSSGSFARSLPLARSARTAGSWVPATRASSMRRADTPRVSEATEVSLIPASCRTLSRRWTSRARSSIWALRYQLCRSRTVCPNCPFERRPIRPTCRGSPCGYSNLAVVPSLGRQLLGAHVAHGEVVEVVRNKHCSVGSSGSRDQCVGRVNRPPLASPLGLVQARTGGSVPGCLEEREPVHEGLNSLALPRPEPSFDLGDVDASRSQRVASSQQVEEALGHVPVSPQMGDQDRCVEHVLGQVSSVLRTFRTQAAVEARSRQSR